MCCVVTTSSRLTASHGLAIPNPNPNPNPDPNPNQTHYDCAAMGETLLSPDGVRLTLGVFDMDLGISPAGVQAKEVVTLYGYDSYDFVQPSTYPNEWVTPENVDIVFDESVVDGQKVTLTLTLALALALTLT